jgi:hypothetical protein
MQTLCCPAEMQFFGDSNYVAEEPKFDVVFANRLRIHIWHIVVLSSEPIANQLASKGSPQVPVSRFRRDSSRRNRSPPLEHRPGSTAVSIVDNPHSKAQRPVCMSKKW